MAIPAHIKVGPFDIAVVEIDAALAERLREDGDFHRHTIHVAKGQHGPALADTVLHELLHAIFQTFALKDDDDEERTISALATGLIGVLRDNPNLGQWLTEQANQTPRK